MPYSIGIIGTGRLGSILAYALHKSGIQITHLINRTVEKTAQLKKLTGATVSNSIPTEIDTWPDLWMICVNDDQIASVVTTLGQLKNQVRVYHTSGSLNTSALHTIAPLLGVIYPLQSFSDERFPQLKNVPFCIFAPDETGLELAIDIAKKLSKTYHIIKDEDRAYLHLAAVFINNFTNVMCDIANEIVLSRQLPFDLLKPLLQETIDKLDTLSPDKAQTGPAIRGDQVTIDRHMKLLKDFDDSHAQLYTLLTDIIQNKKK